MSQLVVMLITNEGIRSAQHQRYSHYDVTVCCRGGMGVGLDVG